MLIIITHRGSLLLVFFAQQKSEKSDKQAALGEWDKLIDIQGGCACYAMVWKKVKSKKKEWK